MADEKDALANFDFDQFSGAGLFLRFKADKPVTLRVLTTDPVISQTEFTDKKTGEINLQTRFNFIVYNFTESKAQILGASASMGQKIGSLHTDPDFGADIRKIDIKITPTGEGLERRYDLQVLPVAKTLTNEMIQEARAIDLDTAVKDGKGRMSQWSQKSNTAASVGSGGSNDEAAAAAAEQERLDKEAAENPDPIIKDIGDEPINLDDIPF